MQNYQRLVTSLVAITIIPLPIYFSVGVVVQKSILENFQKVGGDLLPGNIATARTMTELYQILLLAEQYAKSRNIADKEKVEEVIQNLEVHVATHTLYHKDSHSEQETREINLLIHRFSSFISEYLHLVRKGATPEELYPVKLKIDKSLDSFVVALNPIIDRELRESSKTLQRAKQQNANVFNFLMGFGVLTIGLALVLIYFIYRRFRAMDMENENFKHNLESLVAKRTRQLNEKNDALRSEISEKIKVESELRDSEKNLETVFNSAIPICITSINSEIIKANQSYCDIWSISGDSLKCYESRPGSLCKTKLCPIQQIKSGKKEVVIEEQKRDKKGKLRDFIITIKPFYGNTGELLGIAESFQEITERKKAEAEKLELEKGLRQAHKMEAIGTLAGGIAHDFNNLLMAISGYNQLILKKVGDNPPIIHDLKQVNIATDRATDLVKQILTFSRQTEHVKKPINITAIIQEALKLLRSSIPANIEIKQTIQGQWNIMADPTQIHQVVMNLVTNGYHALLDTGGSLGVSLSEVTIKDKEHAADIEVPLGEYICLEVSDNGCGMDEETKAKIFEPYFTTKEINKGTGLGLAVVHGIVMGHNGYINIASELGKGTTFYIYLPRVEEEQIDAELLEEQGHVVGGNERIMVIDDENILAVLMDLVLSGYGYKTSCYTNSTQAVNDFVGQPDGYDLIITDMAMPHMTGLEVTQKIKAIRPNIPIILCSGFSKAENEKKALSLGVARYLHKPVDIRELARVVRELLDME